VYHFAHIELYYLHRAQFFQRAKMRKLAHGLTQVAFAYHVQSMRD
jgi:hypothetical protein